jgi:molybdate transport system substrate-binding protein
LKKVNKPFFLLFLFFLLIGCSNQKDKTGLTISAASSMTESLSQLAMDFEKQYPNIDITYNFGGTGTLRKQVEQGAPIDLFFLASEKDYNLLKERELIQEGIPILENRLVMIKHSESEVESINDLIQTNKKIAIGTPEAVPAGSYAKEALQSMKMWEALEDRIVFTKDVYHVLKLVEEGAVQTGIVYYTDTLNASNITVVENIDSSFHSPIRYFLAKINKDNKNAEAVEAFSEFANSESSMKLFESYGFKINSKTEQLEGS